MRFDQNDAARVVSLAAHRLGSDESGGRQGTPPAGLRGDRRTRIIAGLA
jgi:hypothetical protein